MDKADLDTLLNDAKSEEGGLMNDNPVIEQDKDRLKQDNFILSVIS